MKTIEELLADLRGFRNRASEIDAENAGRAMSPEAQNEWNEVNAAIDETQTLVEELRTRSARLEQLAQIPENTEHERSAPQVRRAGATRTEDIYDLSSIRSAAFGSDAADRELRDRAMRSIDSSTFAWDDDDCRSQVAGLVDNPEVAKRILVTGSPQYRSAFMKFLSEQPLNSEEIRAMSLTGASGGFASVPYQLDPSIVRTSALSINPIRQLAKVVQITGSSYKGIQVGAIVASYDAEASEVSDDSPTYAQPSINVSPARAFVPFSFEIEEDYPGLLTDLGALMAEAKDTLEASKFWSGTGTGEPQGLSTGLAAGQTVTTAGVAAITVADLYALDNAVPARYQSNLSIVAHRSFYNRVRSFDTTGGSSLWIQLGQGVGVGGAMPTLMGIPAYQATVMASVLTTGSTVAVEGDIRSAYTIVDRIGMSVERVQNLFGAAGRPTGQRGILAHWRNAAAVTNADAVRRLVTG